MTLNGPVKPTLYNVPTRGWFSLGTSFGLLEKSHLESNLHIRGKLHINLRTLVKIKWKTLGMTCEETLKDKPELGKTQRPERELLVDKKELRSD